LVKTYKYLGVIMDDMLSWKDQVKKKKQSRESTFFIVLDHLE